MNATEFRSIILDSDEDVAQYGVLGMKWGVRKDPRKAYSKAISKLRRIDKKVTKSGGKSDKLANKALGYQIKADKQLAKATTARKVAKANKTQAKATKYRLKANRQALKSNRNVDKAKKWLTSMKKVFSDTKYSDLNPEDVAFGKQYAQFIFDYERRRR